MLIKIDFDPKNIVYQSNGRIILKARYYGEFSTVAHLCTVEGQTEQEFKANKVLSSKNIFVGQKGGITVE